LPLGVKMSIEVTYIPQVEQIEVTPVWSIFNEPVLLEQPLY